MLRARYIIVEEKTGIVVNAFIVEDFDSWPPQAVGTITVGDNIKKYNIGDYYRTPLSEVLKKDHDDDE